MMFCLPKMRTNVTKYVLLWLVATTVSFPIAARAQTSEVNAQNVLGDTNTLHDGTAIPAGFHFDLGSFGSFVPTILNESSWLANWTLAPEGSSTYTGSPFNAFSIASTLTSNARPFSTSTPGFIWGYNTQTPNPTAEWILVGDSTWVWPGVSAPPPTPDTWSTGGLGSSVANNVVLGSIGSNGDLTTALVTIVPEPSTLPLMGFGLVALIAFGRPVRDS